VLVRQAVSLWGGSSVPGWPHAPLRPARTNPVFLITSGRVFLVSSILRPILLRWASTHDQNAASFCLLPDTTEVGRNSQSDMHTTRAFRALTGLLIPRADAVMSRGPDFAWTLRVNGQLVLRLSIPPEALQRAPLTLPKDQYLSPLASSQVCGILQSPEKPSPGTLHRDDITSTKQRRGSLHLRAACRNKPTTQQKQCLETLLVCCR